MVITHSSSIDERRASGEGCSRPFSSHSARDLHARLLPPAAPAPARGAEVLLGDHHQRAARQVHHLHVAVGEQVDQLRHAGDVAQLAGGGGGGALAIHVRAAQLVAQLVQQPAQRGRGRLAREGVCRRATHRGIGVEQAQAERHHRLVGAQLRQHQRGVEAVVGGAVGEALDDGPHHGHAQATGERQQRPVLGEREADGVRLAIGEAQQAGEALGDGGGGGAGRRGQRCSGGRAGHRIVVLHHLEQPLHLGAVDRGGQIADARGARRGGGRGRHRPGARDGRGDRGAHRPGGLGADPGRHRPGGLGADPGRHRPGGLGADPGRHRPGGLRTDPGGHRPGGLRTDPGRHRPARAGLRAAVCRRPRFHLRCRRVRGAHLLRLDDAQERDRGLGCRVHQVGQLVGADLTATVVDVEHGDAAPAQDDGQQRTRGGHVAAQEGQRFAEHVLVAQGADVGRQRLHRRAQWRR